MKLEKRLTEGRKRWHRALALAAAVNFGTKLGAINFDVVVIKAQQNVIFEELKKLSGENADLKQQVKELESDLKQRVKELEGVQSQRIEEERGFEQRMLPQLQQWVSSTFESQHAAEFGQMQDTLIDWLAASTIEIKTELSAMKKSTVALRQAPIF